MAIADQIEGNGIRALREDINRTLAAEAIDRSAKTDWEAGATAIKEAYERT